MPAWYQWQGKDLVLALHVQPDGIEPPRWTCRATRSSAHA
jgi:hypothetical protein